MRLTPSDRRRFGAQGGDHIGIDVEAACCRSDYDDLGPDWSGDMAFHRQLGEVARGGIYRPSRYNNIAAESVVGKSWAWLAPRIEWVGQLDG